MNLHIWDVQHGSAAYLKTPTGRHLVFDLGVGDTSKRDEFFSPLRHIRSLGIRQLDLVLITHPHRDHLDDIVEFDGLSPIVLHRPQHLTEAQIRAGNRPGDSRILDKYLEIDRRYTHPVPEAFHIAIPMNWGMEIVTYQPTGCDVSNLNNHSIVTFLRHEGSTVCIPGDNESQSWQELLALSSFRTWLAQVDVLVAPHHGREAGYCEDIFQYCRPRLVVVSDGPASDTTAVAKYRAKAAGWDVWSRATWTKTRRQVLTTRSDNSIFISTGVNADGRFLQVTIQ